MEADPPIPTNITQNSYFVQNKNGEFYNLLDDGTFQKYDRDGNKYQPAKDKPNAVQQKLNNQLETSKKLILLNCDKSKMLIFVYDQKRDPIFQVYDCSSAEEILICNAKESLGKYAPTIKDVKWSYYSPDVFACLSNKEIVICQLSKENHMYSLKERVIPLNDETYYAFTWGDSCNIWLKYSIAYSSSHSNNIYLMRPATPIDFQLPFKDYLKMISTLDATSSLRFSKFITTKGTSRILSIKNNAYITTEIPTNVSSKIAALQWVNSYLNNYLIAIDERSTIYIITIKEVDNFVRDFSNSNYLSFLSANSAKFEPSESLISISCNDLKNFNFSYSNGFFFNTGKKLYRLFLRRKRIKYDSVNDINNNEDEIDGNSIFDVVNIDEYESICQLTLLAEFDDIRGVYGDHIIVHDKIEKIGQFPESIKKIDFSKLSEEERENYAKSFDHSKIKRRLEMQRLETQRLRMMNEIVQGETDMYINKESEQFDEVKKANEELAKLQERAEELPNRMQNIMSKLQMKLSNTKNKK